jgi:hypothetical protein
MEISVAEPNEIEFFTPMPITSLEQMADLCLKKNFSPGIFKDGKRNLVNFQTAHCIGLDVDNDEKPYQGKPTPKMTLEEAKEAFKEYTHLILPSRSHQKEKDGVVEDRFRIILFFTEPISDKPTFYATWKWCKEKWPAIDHQCKDPSRFYYKHSAIESIRKKGLRVAPVAPPLVEESERMDLSNIPVDARGKLSREALEHLVFGISKGNRNGETFKLAKEFQQNHYTIEEAQECIISSLESTGTIASDFPRTEVIVTIKSAYSSEAKHDPRGIKPRAFNLLPINELYKTNSKVEWIVDGVLTVGGVSLISSDPKAGKSTLVRQLMRDVLRGSKFLGRQCKQGSVQYYGIEEQLEVVNASFKRLGVTGEDSLLVHVGDPVGDSTLNDFREILNETKPTLAVIDTLFDFLEVESENNYKEVKRELRKIRNIARETGTHILLVHHNSKGSKDDRRRGNRGILGSQAIAGGVDTIMVIEVEGNTRLVTTSGREIKRWINRELVFDVKNTTYSLGPESESDEF